MVWACMVEAVNNRCASLVAVFMQVDRRCYDSIKEVDVANPCAAIGCGLAEVFA